MLLNLCCFTTNYSLWIELHRWFHNLFFIGFFCLRRTLLIYLNTCIITWMLHSLCPRIYWRAAIDISPRRSLPDFTKHNGLSFFHQLQANGFVRESLVLNNNSCELWFFGRKRNFFLSISNICRSFEWWVFLTFWARYCVPCLPFLSPFLNPSNVNPFYLLIYKPFQPWIFSIHKTRI